MNEYQREFYDNWNGKLTIITGDDLMSVFDKFYTAYVIYNFLYNQVSLYQIKRGVSVPKQLSDRNAATGFMVQAFGASVMIEEIEQTHTEDIETIKQLITEERFYINLNYGDRQRNEDLRLLEELNSNSGNKRMTAITKIIYYVRCNLFHGHKDFVQAQSELLLPLTNILITLNNLVYNRLTE